MNYCLTIVCALTVSGVLLPHDKKGCYFNTKFLRNYDEVKRTLMSKEGFVNGFLTTSDGIKINYLWLKRTHARYTIICSGGFWPGRKEGLAPLYKIFPEDCNLLLFDARGHGDSQGSMLQSIWRYGTHERRDVVAAIAWVHAYTQMPIVVFGICAGAFHSSHALLTLNEKKLLEQYQVKALIFDSGWRSLLEVAETTFPSEWCKRVRKTGAAMPRLLRALAGKVMGWPVAKSLQLFIRCGVTPWYWRHNKSTTLAKRIGQLPVPIFYIHSLDDMYAHIEPIKALARNSQQPHSWWITEPSSHASHHLKHATQYKIAVASFLSQIV